MAAIIDNRSIRGLSPTDLVARLRQLQQKHTDTQITQHLFDSAQRKSVSPKALGIWISTSHSPTTLLAALKQDFSVCLRHDAITHLSKLWRSRRWRVVWTGLGGTDGVVQLLSQFSVVHVKHFVGRMRLAYRGPDVEERGKVIADLLSQLSPRFAGKEHCETAETVDERPIADLYRGLLPACDSGFVDKLVRRQMWDGCADQAILGAHYEVFRTYLKENILNGNVETINGFAALIHHVPSGKTADGIPETMLFGMELLKEFVDFYEKYSSDEFSIFKSLMQPLIKRAWKYHRRFGSKYLEQVVRQSLIFLKSNPEEAKHLNFTTSNFFRYVILSWSSFPASRDFFESAISSCLELMPHSESSETMEHFEPTIEAVHRPLRYQLLRLFFLHYRTRPGDIDSNGYLAKIQEAWSINIFMTLEREAARKLLLRLQKVVGEDLKFATYSRLSIFSSGSNVDKLRNLLGVLGHEQGSFTLLFAPSKLTLPRFWCDYKRACTSRLDIQNF
jgi:hypothetical protein